MIANKRTDEILSVISGRQEGRRLEFKPGFHWTEEKSKKIREELIKAIIAMANTPSGGDIVLGMKWNQSKSKHEAKGVKPKELKYFTNNYEKIEQQVHKYCSQTPEFEIQWGAGNGC